MLLNLDSSDTIRSARKCLCPSYLENHLKILKNQPSRPFQSHAGARPKPAQHPHDGNPTSCPGRHVPPKLSSCKRSAYCHCEPARPTTSESTTHTAQHTVQNFGSCCHILCIALHILQYTSHIAVRRATQPISRSTPTILNVPECTRNPEGPVRRFTTNAPNKIEN